jgi:hypothetical protein
MAKPVHMHACILGEGPSARVHDLTTSVEDGLVFWGAYKGDMCVRVIEVSIHLYFYYI